MSVTDFAAYLDGGSCSFAVHADEVPDGPREETMSRQQADLETDADGYWRCPHPSMDNTDTCVFHTPLSERPADVAADEQLVALVTADDPAASRRDRRRARQFIGAEFDDLVLDYLHLRTGDNHVIDLRCCSADKLSCESTTVESPVDVRGATVDRFLATKAQFEQLYAQHIESELLELDQGRIDRAYFQHCEIHEARFYWTEISYVNYHECNIRWANFLYAQLGEAGFFDSTFHVATFCNMSVDGAYLNDAEFTYVNYHGVDGRTHFDGVEAHVANFSSLDASKLSLKGASFELTLLEGAELGTLDATGAALGIANATGADIERFDATDTSFEGSLLLDEASLGELEIDPPEEIAGRWHVSLTDAELDGGLLLQPADEGLIYDFTGATVGDVELRGEEGLLELVRFLRTEFDGFRFERLPDVNFDEVRGEIHSYEESVEAEVALSRERQAAALELHPAFGDADPLGASGKRNEIDFGFLRQRGIETSTRERADELAAERVPETLDSPSLSSLEATYLNAKNGASAVGDSLTAGRFFETERRFRRKRHWQAAVSADDPGTTLYRGSQWLRNGVFAATAGYGERPLRVVLSSVGVVTFFSGVYLLLGGDLAGVDDPGALDYLLFSFQSFITFIVGPPAATEDVSMRLASSLEGFLGAFLVALFVFALTRQVHR